jgi:GNAT superfamily N-acetyltransferase
VNTPMLSMRPAGSGDEQEIVRVIHAAFAEYEGRLVPPSGAHAETAETIAERLRHGALLAESGAAPIGCVFCREDGEDLYLSRLAVVPSWRRRGIARSLLEAACELGRARGLACATVGVRLQLPENIGFFVAMGFRPYDVGTHEGFRWPTFLRMRRRLEEEAR